jgi:hypothetical protein
MDGMTTDDRLLAQDDIDALLGEAGIEGKYETKEEPQKSPGNAPKKKPSVRFTRVSEEDVRFTMSILRNKAFLEREDDVKVIWNASGTIPMASGFSINIQDRDYVSLGVLHENHLVVKDIGSGQQP